MKSGVLTAIGSLLVAIGLFYWGYSAGMPEVYQFPMLIAGAMIVLSALMLVDVLSWARVGKVEDPIGANPISIRKMWPAFALVLAYLLLVRTVGFYVTAFLIFMAMVTIYARRSSLDPRLIAYRLTVALAFTGVLYALFSMLLRVQTPRGLFF